MYLRNFNHGRVEIVSLGCYEKPSVVVVVKVVDGVEIEDIVAAAVVVDEFFDDVSVSKWWLYYMLSCLCLGRVVVPVSYLTSLPIHVETSARRLQSPM